MKTISKIAQWSWTDIRQLYQVYGKQLNQYKELKERLEKGDIKMELNINNPDLLNIFVGRFMRDVRKIDSQINVLDQEISRRNNLIGVV